MLKDLASMAVFRIGFIWAAILFFTCVVPNMLSGHTPPEYYQISAMIWTLIIAIPLHMIIKTPKEAR